MFKDVLRDSNLTIFATVGLVVFFVAFTGVIVWVLTRPKKKVDQWAHLPLEEGKEPVEPIQKRETARDPQSDPSSESSPESPTDPAQDPDTPGPRA